MICLGIESTAHTFGVSVAEKELEDDTGRTFKIISDIRDSYKAPEGSGIHPREAARHHAAVCSSVVESALKQAGVSIEGIDFISYSAGPGLGPCLRIGGIVARSLSAYFDMKLAAANHAIGHIELGKYLTSLKNPLVLIVSGGHTALAAVQGERWRIFGETLDLTLGQLLDQLGRFIGMSSPAGPKIEKLALEGMKNGGSLLKDLPYTIKGNDVSYSGLLSAAKKLCLRGERKEDVCYAVQEIAFSTLAEATDRALAFTGISELLITGGVAANKRLAEVMQEVCKERGIRMGVIDRQYSGDCGAQIAAEGFRLAERKQFIRPDSAFVRQSWRLDEVVL